MVKFSIPGSAIKSNWTRIKLVMYPTYETSKASVITNALERLFCLFFATAILSFTKSVECRTTCVWDLSYDNFCD